MTAITRTPINPNPLHSNKFTLNFGRLPSVQYFCQSATIPGLTIAEVNQNTPFIDLYVPGEKLIYDTFDISFIVDEDLTSWKEIHDWIRAMTFPENFDEYKNLGRLAKNISSNKTPQYSDAILQLYTAAYNPSYKIKLYDCFPISLSSIPLSAMDSPDNILTIDASFRFAYYDIEKN